MKTKCNNIMFLSVCILYSLLVTTSCNEFHDKVFTNLLRLCPGQYVPTDNGTVHNQTSEFDSCCTDKFSDFSPTNSMINKTEHTKNGQSCLFPRTDVVKEQFQTEMSYSMVTEPPEHGCLLPDNDAGTIKGDNFNHPTCDDSDVSPFRRLLPVFSKSTGFVYKNPHCASCHGQYDVIIWTPVSYCRADAAFSFEPEECVFQFVYPGDQDDIRHLECFTDYYSACPVDTTADSDKFRAVIDLSVNELTDACSMDNLPKFTDSGFAKNVFCYICHNCEGGCSFLKRKCNPPVNLTPFRSWGEGFARILDSRVVGQLHTDHDTFCGLDRDERVCHEWLCPLGQVLTFDGLEKKCLMDSTKWTARRFSILLLLEFKNRINVHVNLEAILTQIQSPWSKSWYIEVLYHPFASNVELIWVAASLYNVTKALPVKSIDHLYVQLTYRRTTVNPVVLLRELENLLMKSVSIAIDGKRHRARQTLGKSTFRTIIDVSSSGDSFQQIQSMPVWQLSPDVKPYTRWLYKSLLVTLKRNPAYFLNKLMLCKQVELTSANFHVTTYSMTGSKTPIMLYYNRTGQYLYDNEFTKGSGRNGEQSFRLCVSDAQLESNESVRLQIRLKLLLLAMVIFNVL